MRLAILANTFSPWVRTSLQELSALGHEIHAFEFAEQKSAYLKQDSQAAEASALRDRLAGIHQLSPKGTGNLRYAMAAPELRTRLKDVRAEFLLTLYGGGFAQLAYLSGFRPFGVFTVGSDVLFQTGIRRWITRHCLEAASLVFANGTHLAERTRELAPRAEVIPLLLGVDLEKYRFGAPSEISEFLSNRGFRYPYNNEQIIRALAKARCSRPFKFYFASAGPDLQKCVELADAILPPDVRKSVEFLGGVTGAKMDELLGRCRFFVSMSRSDGTATSLLEAMACGLYPILSDIPQNREWINPTNPNGKLARLDSPEELAGALQQAIDDPAMFDRYREANRGLVEARADSRRNMAALAGYIASVLERNRTPS